ncbi:MAG TPA: alpha/beta fold hydrolase [Sediminibacterium sp.]|nr:alpha/beta fold hydrolase [Sediminibacterium sp.]
MAKQLIVALLLLLNQAGIPISAHSQVGKPVYVLVHGAWHGGWCWQDVSQHLSGRGYSVYTPTLSGLGEHKNNINRNINLQTHITDIINLIEMEDLRNVILVGHSYAGAIIAGVADSIPNRLNKLVYLDAMIVKNGESALSVQTNETQTYMNSIIVKKQNIPPIRAENFGIVDSAKALWVNKRLTPQPFNSFTERLKLKNNFGNKLPLVYITCSESGLPVLEKFREEVIDNPQWKHYVLKAGHDAMIAAPRELSEMLISLSH